MFIITNQLISLGINVFEPCHKSYYSDYIQEGISDLISLCSIQHLLLNALSGMIYNESYFHNIEGDNHIICNKLVTFADNIEHQYGVCIPIYTRKRCVKIIVTHWRLGDLGAIPVN